jgi:DNA-binding GntR family transcriptional regulator
MHVVAPLERRSLHDELVERLREIVVEEDLAAGQKVPERELCERLGVSRTPLREALKVLAVDGLITLIPNRGAVVKQLTRAEIEDLFPVMGALEALSGELACNCITDAEIRRIEKIHNRMVGYFENEDLPKYFQCNRKIHEYILEASRNQTLTNQYQSLAIRLRRARYMANMSMARWSRAVQEHEAILSALKKRDGQHLAGILKRHLAEKFEAVLAHMDRKDAAP